MKFDDTILDKDDKSGIIELDVDVVVLFHPFNPPSTSPYFIASAWKSGFTGKQGWKTTKEDEKWHTILMV